MIHITWLPKVVAALHIDRYTDYSMRPPPRHLSPATCVYEL